jgi:LysM repeat protein
MSAIALRFGTTVAAISALNNIANPSLIRVGQVLRLP